MNLNDNIIQTENINLKKNKKKVTFDDILSNMNLVVNEKGILQYMSYNQNEIAQPKEPINPGAKNSYIYNKYFKDYKDPSAAEINEPIKPKTMEEYRQLVLQKRIEQIEQIKRISQIKSKKLLFTNNIAPTNNMNGNINVTKNNLRRMQI
jgi:hypothetical protein